MNEIPIFELHGNYSINWDTKIGSILYNYGFYGKPLGLRKTKPGYIDRPLILSLFETLYLLKQGIIKVTKNDKLIKVEELRDLCFNKYDDFENKYIVYSHLRDLGYILKPGMKFGSDFAVYIKGPGIDHSKYVVHVEDDKTKLRAINIVRAGRLAASVKKGFLVSTVSESKPKYYNFERAKL